MAVNPGLNQVFKSDLNLPSTGLEASYGLVRGISFAVLDVEDETHASFCLSISFSLAIAGIKRELRQ